MCKSPWGHVLISEWKWRLEQVWMGLRARIFASPWTVDLGVAFLLDLRGFDTWMTAEGLCQRNEIRPLIPEDRAQGLVMCENRGSALWVLQWSVGLGLQHWDARHAKGTMRVKPELRGPKEVSFPPNLALLANLAPHQNWRASLARVAKFK